MRYILHDHIGSANHGCEALVRTVSKLLGPGRTVLLSEAPEEDARYGVARPLVVQDVRPARSDVIRKSSPAFWNAFRQHRGAGREVVHTVHSKIFLSLAR